MQYYPQGYQDNQHTTQAASAQPWPTASAQPWTTAQSNYQQMPGFAPPLNPNSPQPWGPPPPTILSSQQPPPPQGNAMYASPGGMIHPTVIIHQPPRQPINRNQKPPNDCCAALLALFCFCPTGLVALVKAKEGNEAWQRGDHEGAWRISRTTRQWVLASIVIGICLSIMWNIIHTHLRRNGMHPMFYN